MNVYLYVPAPVHIHAHTQSQAAGEIGGEKLHRGHQPHACMHIMHGMHNMHACCHGLGLNPGSSKGSISRAVKALGP